MGQHNDEQHAGNANISLISPAMQKNNPVSIFQILSPSNLDYAVVAPRMMQMIRPLSISFKREPKTKQLINILPWGTETGSLSGVWMLTGLKQSSVFVRRSINN